MEKTVDKEKTEKSAIRGLADDLVKSAKEANLVYTHDGKSGFSRKKRGKIFYFFDGTQEIKDGVTIERINKLRIPPAWENVWICRIAEGHLQSTGTEELRRKQYRYHSLWIKTRNQTKFYRLREFGLLVPAIRKKIEKDLSLGGSPQDKILAAVVSLLERTNIRVGNEIYEKLYGSFGLTTLKNRQVVVKGTRLRFIFKGKKGVQHNITLKSKTLSRIIKSCKDIPGKDLFEFYDGNGAIKTIDSGMVNNYISKVTGGEFTTKDFRTWAGTVNALAAFSEIGCFKTASEMNQNIRAAFEMTAKQLGNSATVCKNYYIHPIVVELYKEKNLGKYLRDIKVTQANDGQKELMPIEKALLTILNHK